MRKFRARLALIIVLPAVPFVALSFAVAGYYEDVSAAFSNWIRDFKKGSF